MTLFGISGNYIAIVAGAVAAFIIGMIWYTVLFGKMWSAGHGFSEQRMKEMQSSAPMAAGVSFFGYLVTGYVMSLLFTRLGITEMNDALYTAFLLWLAFPAVMILMNTMYSGHSMVVYLIDVLYQLVYVLAIAALLVWLS
jgi:hypothetical protein